MGINHKEITWIIWYDHLEPKCEVNGFHDFITPLQNLELQHNLCYTNENDKWTVFNIFNLNNKC